MQPLPRPIQLYDSILDSAEAQGSLNVTKETSELQNIFEQGEQLAKLIKKARVGTQIELLMRYTPDNPNIMHRMSSMIGSPAQLAQ